MTPEARATLQQLVRTAPELVDSLNYTGEMLVDAIACCRPLLEQPSMQAAGEALVHLDLAAKAVARLKESIEESERNRASLN